MNKTWLYLHIRISQPQHLVERKILLRRVAAFWHALQRLHLVGIHLRVRPLWLPRRRFLLATTAFAFWALMASLDTREGIVSLIVLLKIAACIPPLPLRPESDDTVNLHRRRSGILVLFPSRPRHSEPDMTRSVRGLVQTLQPMHKRVVTLLIRQELRIDVRQTARDLQLLCPARVGITKPLHRLRLLVPLLLRRLMWLVLIHIQFSVEGVERRPPRREFQTLHFARTFIIIFLWPGVRVLTVRIEGIVLQEKKINSL